MRRKNAAGNRVLLKEVVGDKERKNLIQKNLGNSKGKDVGSIALEPFLRRDKV